MRLQDPMHHIWSLFSLLVFRPLDARVNESNTQEGQAIYYVTNPFVISMHRCYGCLASGGWGTLYHGLYGKAPPERSSFFRLEVYKR